MQISIEINGCMKRDLSTDAVEKVEIPQYEREQDFEVDFILWHLKQAKLGLPNFSI
jgi:hypothetical protein